MKIKIIDKSYSDVMALPTPKHRDPKKINFFFRALTKILASVNLRKNNMTYREHGMDKLSKKEPYLVLMNHSSFIDISHNVSDKPNYHHYWNY